MVIVTAGTSDLPVAEEARVTAEAWNCEVSLVADVGVAGLHRLLHQLPALGNADALVVVAGMEGALPSVVGGLVDCPVIAVPTSIGYGAHFQGLAALLGMLNSCASNVVVVNIDAGFNGGHVAGLIARRAGLARLSAGPPRDEAGRRRRPKRIRDGRGSAAPTSSPLTAWSRADVTRSERSHGLRTGRIDPVAASPSRRQPQGACTARCSSSPGGRGMAGAAALCGRLGTAVRGGAGAGGLPGGGPAHRGQLRAQSYMTYPLPDDDEGMIRLEPSLPVLERLIAPADVVAVGPGLGQSDDDPRAGSLADRIDDQAAGDRRRRARTSWRARRSLLSSV